MNSPFIRESLLQARSETGVQCLTCERRCAIAEGERGWCRTRENRGGTLYTLIYGDISSLSCNPIEKKPLYHFYPGSLALTAGSWSCNLDCPWCQNNHLSKRSPVGWRFLAPEEFVDLARRGGCRGTSISFNEPTLSLEWALEVFRLARDAGLYNTFVTNGYMTEEALRLLVEAGLDGMNVDMKGDPAAVRRHCGVDAEVIWRNCRRARELGVWVEMTTLVIVGVNDGSRALDPIARRIARELGSEVPWHLSRYYPAHRFTVPPTPLATLRRARDIALRAGLRYVYLGNLPGGLGESTSCPGCGARIVTREGLRLLDCGVGAEGRCPRCGIMIPGAGWGWPQEEAAPS